MGRVTGWQECGGPALLEVDGVEGEELLVPFARSICVEIDPAARRIVVDLPEGLKDLNRSMIFHVLTIFPEFFRGPFEHGVVARAAEAGLFRDPHPRSARLDVSTGTGRWTTGLSAAAKACC